MIKVPEIILFNAVQGALKYIRLNYAAQADKDRSYLRRVLTGTTFQRYDFVAQAEQVFLIGEDHPRFLDIDLMFNMERDGVPNMYISLPGEGTQMGGNGIGSDEGYMPEILIENTYNPDGSIDVQGETISVFTRRFQATYNIIITSDNSNEVVLIYHTMKALLLSFIPSMHLAGLENVTISGQDVTIKEDLAGKALFVRAISISLQYESSAPNVFTDPLFKSITAQGTPIN